MVLRVPGKCIDGFRITRIGQGLSQSVNRAADAFSTAVQNVGIDHGGLDIFMPQELLNGAIIVACLQEVSGERMPKGMTGRMLRDARPSDGGLYSLLDDRPI